MHPAIEARGLTKHYGKTAALSGLDLVAPAGRVTAVLGPNGAGKSTFVRAVATLVQPDGGELVVAGLDARHDPAGVRRAIGLAGQYAAVEEAMTGRENLIMISRLFGHTRRGAVRAAAVILEQFSLVEHGDRLVRTYSGGLRRRLDVAASLAGMPRVLLLDEPTTGLDPRSRAELWGAIRDLVAGGTDVLLTTQYLDEADHLAQHIVIVDHGRAIATGTPDELKAQAGRDVVEVRTRHSVDTERVANALARLGNERPRIDDVARRVTVGVHDGAARLRDAIRVLDDAGIALDDIGLRRPTLDEVFLALTGHPADAADDDHAATAAA